MIRISIQWLWVASHGIRFHLLTGIVAGVLHVCTSLLFIWICKQLIDIATYNTQGNILYFAVLLVIVVVLQLFFSAWYRRIESCNDIRFKNNLRYKLFSRLMLSRWNGREHFHSGDVVNRLEEDVRLVSEAVCVAIPSVAITGFQMVAAFIFLWYLDSRLAWIIVLLMPFFLLISKFYMRRMRCLTKEIRSLDSKVQSHIQEKIQNKTLIQTLGQHQSVIDILGIFQTGLYRQVMSRTDFSLFSRTLVMAGFAAGYVTAFLWSVNGIHARAVSFGAMTAFLQLVGQIQRPMVELSGNIPVLANAIVSAERLKELEVLPLEQQGEEIKLNGSLGVKLKNVSFSYPDGNRKIISNFSYDFTPGSRTAIVGETGVGKSTLIRMILALLHQQTGYICLYNGKQEEAVSPLTRCNMVYVPQGNSLLSGTIRDNLMLGNPEATEEQIREALTIAAAEFVFDLPDELNTLCGEHGAGLSEGQAQRICIARGLLRPGTILLLDEFSSSLDKKTESLLMNRLISQAIDKTLIFITHREKITEYCEQVIRL